MAGEFQGKVAFITGGSDGIGLATAQLLARGGAHVVICARRPDRLAAALAAIRAEGSAEAHQLDVSDSDAFAALVADVAARHGRLDMMVNNAMSVHYAPIGKLTLEHWRKEFAVNADAVASYLNAQIDAGAQAVMIFDSWGGVLADGAFQEFSLEYTRRVLAQLKRTGTDGQIVPRLVFTKGGGLWLKEMAALDCEVLGLDWTVNLGSARSLVGGVENGPGKALQGNIDPNVLFAPPAQIAKEVGRVLDSFGVPYQGSGTGPTHIFNLGHGISQYTPPENVAALVEAVHTHSKGQRA